MKINVDKLVGLLVSLGVALLPVLTQDGVITGKLATDLGLVLGSLAAGYHVKPGLVLGRQQTPEPPATPTTPDMQTPQN